jgi:hypothetical protein
MQFVPFKPSSPVEDMLMSVQVSALCLHQGHTTGRAIGLDFTALEHREATRFLADEKTKGLTAEQVFSHASVLMIRAIKSTEPESASLARFFAAACVIAAREVNNFGTDMNCLSADEDPSGQQIARYFMCGYADPIEVIRTDIPTIEGAQPPAA